MGETGADEPVIRYLRADIVDARIRAALEAAAKRAVEWFDTLGPISPDSLRRAVMGESDAHR